MKRFKGILFDNDGTIVHTDKVFLEAENTLAKIYDKEVTPELTAQMLGKSSAAACQVLADAWGLDITGAELAKQRDEIYFGLLNSLEEPPYRDGILDIIALAKELRIELAIATGSTKSMINAIYSKTDFLANFSAIITSEDVEKGKPDPEIFLKAAAALNLAPEQCIVLEDSMSGLISAINAQAGLIIISPSMSSSNANFEGADLNLETFQHPKVFEAIRS